MERFWSKVGKTDGCWPWKAGVSPKGYGRFAFGREQQAHRISLLLSGVPLPAGAVVHHHCENRACVNPDHLEVIVSAGEHSRRHKADGDRCRRGHVFDYRRKNGTRWCRACAHDRYLERR